MRPKLRSCEVRASVRDRTRSTSFRPSPAIPGTAARVRALSEADPGPIEFIRTVLQSFVPRGHLRDHLRHFIPPRTYCWHWEHVWFVLGDCSPQTGFPAHHHGVGRFHMAVFRGFYSLVFGRSTHDKLEIGKGALGQ